jgi:Ca2+-binding RTX toxin-like protein
MLFDNMRFEGERPAAVTGTDDMDLLIGTDAGETLDGVAGTDELRGEGGDDVLVGGEGDDLLLGGAGDDTLVFEPFSGNDTVGDFAAGAGSEDLLDLRGRGFTDAANVMENATQDGGDVVIDLGNGDSVRLAELSALHADDFLV